MTLHISLAAETLWHLGPIPITNSLVTTWLVMVFLFVVALLVGPSLKRKPGSLQVIVELIIGGFADFFESVLGKQAKEVFPLLISIFLFVIFSNWSGLLPGVGSVGFFHETKEAETFRLVAPVIASSESNIQTTKEPEFTPLFRAPTADLNTTLALALIAVIFIQYFGFKHLGVAYAAKFFNFKNPIMFFIGILELISEISRVISFAFRLFGNIFAGEVLLAVMAFLLPFFLPTPFIALELFVGFIQALVFSMLTAVFLKVAVAHESESR